MPSRDGTRPAKPAPDKARKLGCPSGPGTDVGSVDRDGMEMRPARRGRRLRRVRSWLAFHQRWLQPARTALASVPEIDDSAWACGGQSHLFCGLGRSWWEPNEECREEDNHLPELLPFSSSCDLPCPVARLHENRLLGFGGQ